MSLFLIDTVDDKMDSNFLIITILPKLVIVLLECLVKI